MFIADCMIQPTHFLSRCYGKLRGGLHQLKHHYYLMSAFQLLADRYLVDCAYPNPLLPDQEIRFRLDLCQNTQQWIYRSKGGYELEWIRLFDIALEKVPCFIDVGPHIGIFTLTLAQAHPHCDIRAVEALPPNYILLQENIDRNGLTNVTAVLGAVAKERGEVRFFVNPLNEGGGSLVPFSVYKTGGIFLQPKKYQERHVDFIASLSVPSYRLDDFIVQKSVVKIDVEGSELDVLSSGQEVFAKGLVDMVIVEVGEEATPEVLRWFKAREWDCFTLGSKRPIEIEGPLGARVGYGGRIYIGLRKNTDLYRKIMSHL